MRNAWILLLALVLLVVLPEVAHACPVCFDSRDENRQAFLATTAFLSLLPLGMVGGVGLWMRRRYLELEESEGDDLDQDAPPTDV